MRLWIDAQLSPALAPWFGEEFGVEAHAVREFELQGAKDPEIFARARSAGVVLVTKDSDFVALVESRGAPPQVLWVTCGNTSNAALKATLLRGFPDARRLLDAGEPSRRTRSKRHSQHG